MKIMKRLWRATLCLLRQHENETFRWHEGIVPKKLTYCRHCHFSMLGPVVDPRATLKMMRKILA